VTAAVARCAKPASFEAGFLLFGSPSLPGLTRQSIALDEVPLFSMDARLKPAHDE
jgi:hypothetical protein